MNEKDLKKKFDDPDEEVRRKAVSELEVIDPDRSLELLDRAIGDNSWRVRKAAAEQIIRLGDRGKVIDTLISALGAGDNAGKRNTAVEVLEKLGARAVPKLIANLRFREQEVKKFIVDILGEIKEPEALPELIKALKEESENLRAAAAEALGKLGREEAINPLLELLKDEEPMVRFAALEALGEIGRAGGEIPEGPLAEALKEPMMRKAVYTSLGFSRNLKAAPLLIEGLGDRQRSNREAAVVALVNLYDCLADEEIKKYVTETVQELWVLELSKSLKSYSLEVRVGSAKLLGWLGRGEVTRNLIELTKENQTQDVAMEALIEIGKDASTALTEYLEEDDDPGTRRIICSVLGEIGENVAENVLLKCLKDKDTEIQRSAAVALGKIGSLPALDILTLMMEGEEAETREAAREALILLGKAFPQEVIRSVKKFLDAQNIFIRVDSLKVLGEIGSPEELKDIYFALKDEAHQVRRSAVEILGSKRLENSVDQLSHALADEEAEVRRAAAIALTEIGSEKALEALLMALQDQDVWVRRTAIRGLGRSHVSRFREAVKKMLSASSGVIVISAMEALAENEEEREFLITAIDHPDPEVAKAGIRLMENVDSPKVTKALNKLKEHPNKRICQEAERVLKNRKK
ncbi:MAG: HEAT repeat domain-containing protein [Deltaproteobacteria bacterium]|nr:MAG: HEAT repeat domain-containing protein [Deltaproteobacteria bacterium]